MTRTIQPEQAGKLEQETRTWLANKERLLRDAPGKFVVIKGDRIIGIFDREKDAFAQAYRQLGNVAFLLRPIHDGEKIYYIGGAGPKWTVEDDDAPPEA